MPEDLFKDLKRSIGIGDKLKTPKSIALNYLNRKAWKFHDEFYKTLDYKNYKKIVVIAPRGHGKSEVFGHILPIFVLLNNRNARILIASKAKEQATKLLGVIKQGFENNPNITGDFGELKGTPWQDDKIYLKRDASIPIKDPSVEAVGVGGAITGAHFDLIICDDLIDDKNSRSEKERRNVVSWFRQTLEPLLEPTGRLIVVGTRKHFKDLYQELLDNPIWFHMNCRWDEYGDHRRCGYRAIIKEPGKINPILDERGVVIDFEILGDYEILLPERWSIKNLLLEKNSMGTPAFNSEYQNDPTGLQGLLLDEDWIQYYKENREIEAIPMKMKVMAFDLAIKDKDIEKGDYFAGVVIGLSMTNVFYVIDIINLFLDFPAQVKKIKDWFDFHRPEVVVIETNAYQKALAQHLIDVTTIPVVQLVQTKDKAMRILEMSPYFEGKRVYLRKDMDDLVMQYKEFPRGQHEDLLDAMQMAIAELVNRSTDYEFVGWGPSYRREGSTPAFDSKRKEAQK